MEAGAEYPFQRGAPISGPVPHIFRAVTLAASFLLFKYLIQLNIKPLPSPNYNWIDSLRLWGSGLVLCPPHPPKSIILSGDWEIGWRRERVREGRSE